MVIEKLLTDTNELHLYKDGKLIYTRCLKTGLSKILDLIEYDIYVQNLTNSDVTYKGNDIVQVRAKINMKSTLDGGRKTGFTSGYRPNHIFEYGEDDTFLDAQTFIGEITFTDFELIQPEDEREVMVTFLLSWLPIEKYLNVGRKWYIRDGNGIVGTGEILEFIDK